MQLYKNLGIEKYYEKMGGIGFGLINTFSNYGLLLSEDLYIKLLEIRKKTDESGVEYQFAMLGTFRETNQKRYGCVYDILIDYEQTINDGVARISESFLKKLEDALNSQNYSLCVMCHTHPAFEKTTFDSTVYDKNNHIFKDNLALRDLGMNISNGDILLLINKKIEQYKSYQPNINKPIYFLEGISLPNNEFNVIDIVFDDDNNPSLCAFNDVLTLFDNKLIPIKNVWNDNEKNSLKSVI